MPSGAPPPMQFANLQYAQPQQSSNIGKQMQDLGKNLKAAGVGNLFQQNPLAAGAPIPGAVGPTSAGGPQGPMPLAPPAAAPAQPPAAAPGVPPPQMTPPLQPPPGPSVADATRNMTPPQLLDWLKRMTGAGQQVIPPGMPGSAALSSAGLGMLPSTSPGFGPAPGMPPQVPISQ